MVERKHRVGFTIRRLDHVLCRNLEAHVKKEGIDEITLMHGWVIRYLYENKEKDIFQKDIEKHFSIGRSTVTGILQILEKKGYICRACVEQDARLKKVFLTEKGCESEERIEELITVQNKKMTEGIQPDELEVFLRVAEQIRENLERDKTEEI